MSSSVAKEVAVGDKCSRLEYVCGAGSSIVNVMVTFPINKLMFRQQIEGIRIHKAIRQMKREGLRNMYRGLLPPLMQRTLTVSLMFGTYHSYTQFLESTLLPYSLPHRTLVTHVLAAIGAGSTEAILAPFERVQCLLQVKDYNNRLHNTRHAFHYLYRYGLFEYYRGISAILFRNGLSNTLFLGLREPIKNALPTPQTQLGQSFNSFISGAGLGAGLSTMFFPLNVVKNRMQKKLGGEFLGIKETLLMVYNERGRRVRKIFRGVHINYTRAFLSWGIISTSYDFLKTILKPILF